MTGRWQIRSVEAERSVIGAILVHSKVIEEVLGVVDPEDFTERPLGAVWETMVALDEALIPIDTISVWQHMETSGAASKLRQVGGAELLTTLMGEVVTVENIGYHANIVAKLAERRRWETDLRELTVRAGDQGMDNAEFFGEVESRMLRLMMQRKSTVTTLGSRQAMKTLVNDIERRFEERDKPIQRGVPSGFWGLDNLTGGFQPGQLVIIAARPRVGKTTLAGNMIEYAARRKIPNLMFSLEMGGLEVFERMLAAGGIKANALRTGHLSPDDFIRLTRQASDLADPEKITIDDQGELKIAELRSRARRWRARAGAGVNAMITVDYLQLVKSSRKNSDDVEDVQRIEEVSYGLKALAKELKCPVVALAQLNREADKRTDQRPKLSDLKGSSAIEAAADTILFLYREEIADPECAEEKRNTAELSVGKGRGMQEGKFRLRFDGQYNKFANPKD